MNVESRVGWVDTGLLKLCFCMKQTRKISSICGREQEDDRNDSGSCLSARFEANEKDVSQYIDVPKTTTARRIMTTDDWTRHRPQLGIDEYRLR